MHIKRRPPPLQLVPQAAAYSLELQSTLVSSRRKDDLSSRVVQESALKRMLLTGGTDT